MQLVRVVVVTPATHAEIAEVVAAVTPATRAETAEVVAVATTPVIVVITATAAVAIPATRAYSRMLPIHSACSTMFQTDVIRARVAVVSTRITPSSTGFVTIPAVVRPARSPVVADVIPAVATADDKKQGIRKDTLIFL